MAAEREGVASRVLSWVVSWLMQAAVLPMPSAFVRAREKEPVPNLGAYHVIALIKAEGKTPPNQSVETPTSTPCQWGSNSFESL